MIYFNFDTEKLEFLDEETGIATLLDDYIKSTNKEVTISNTSDAIYKTLLILSSTLFAMVNTAFEPQFSNEEPNENGVPNEDSVGDLISLINETILEDATLGNMSIGKILAGMIGWVEMMVMILWQKNSKRKDIPKLIQKVIQESPEKCYNVFHSILKNLEVESCQ